MIIRFMVSNLMLFGLLMLVAVLIAALLFIARANPRAKTVKTFIQDFFRDVAEIFRPAADRIWCIAKRWWIFWGPRLTNRAAIAMVFGDLSIAASGQDVWMFIAAHKILALAIVVMNLITPLTPAGAPYRIPGRWATGEPAGGPGADTMRAGAHA